MSDIPKRLKSDCLIIGCGVIGMTTARELAMRGLSVAIFDKGEIGKEASLAAGGILSSMRPWSENPGSLVLSNQGKACYAEFVAELKQHTGIDAEYYRSGLLMINQGDVEKTRQWATQNQITFSENTKNYPADMNIPAQSVFLPDIAQVRVPYLLKALLASLRELKVTIFENSPITALGSIDGKCKYVMFGREKVYADNIIVTAGAWSEQALGANNDDIKIKPVLGQMLCVKFAKQALEFILLDGGYYFIPRLDGHVLIGSTIEDVGFNQATTLAARDNLMLWASSLWPEIAEAEFVSHWSGLRPATENGEPYIGKLSAYENVYINAGHFRKGILQAPASASKIADMIC
jgi:glycine oxidase